MKIYYTIDDNENENFITSISFDTLEECINEFIETIKNLNSSNFVAHIFTR